MNLQFWLQPNTIADVMPSLYPHFEAAGICMAAHPRSRGTSWHVASVNDQPMYFGVRYAAPVRHIVVDFLVQRALPATTDALQGAALALIEPDAPGNIVEFCLTELPDAFPILCHKIGGPMALTDLDARVDVSPGQEGYWERAGRALHFISTEELRRHDQDPADLAVRIGAGHQSTTRGSVFVGGWPYPLPKLP